MDITHIKALIKPIEVYKLNVIFACAHTAGIPAYAVTWTLADPANSGVGAATIGAGDAGPYTASNGTLSFYEVL